MKDQKEFMKQMLTLVELAQTNENRIDKREVDGFCSDLKLSEEQLKLVYAFLKEHNIEVSGYCAGKQKQQTKSVTDGSDSESNEDNLNSEDSRYLRIYRRELRELQEPSQEERENLYQRLLAGDETVIHAVIESHLKRVVTLAGKYRNRGVALEDLIQEANLVLITTVDMLCGNSQIQNVRKELDRCIRGRLIELADSQIESTGLENTILARTNLIHEATKVLAEEWGRLATITELAEYTHMTKEEIRMYVDLAQDKIQVTDDNA